MAGRPRLRAARAACAIRLRALEAEEAALVRGSPERQALHARTGVADAETALAVLLAGQGRRSGRAGDAFEAAARAYAAMPPRRSTPATS